MVQSASNCTFGGHLMLAKQTQSLAPAANRQALRLRSVLGLMLVGAFQTPFVAAEQTGGLILPPAPVGTAVRSGELPEVGSTLNGIPVLKSVGIRFLNSPDESNIATQSNTPATVANTSSESLDSPSKVAQSNAAMKLASSGTNGSVAASSSPVLTMPTMIVGDRQTPNTDANNTPSVTSNGKVKIRISDVSKTAPDLNPQVSTERSTSTPDTQSNAAAPKFALPVTDLSVASFANSQVNHPIEKPVAAVVEKPSTSLSTFAVADAKSVEVSREPEVIRMPSMHVYDRSQTAQATPPIKQPQLVIDDQPAKRVDATAVNLSPMTLVNGPATITRTEVATKVEAMPEEPTTSPKLSSGAASKLALPTIPSTSAETAVASKTRDGNATVQAAPAWTTIPTARPIESATPVQPKVPIDALVLDVAHDRKDFNASLPLVDQSSTLQIQRGQNQLGGSNKSTVNTMLVSQSRVVDEFAIQPTVREFEQVNADGSSRVVGKPIPIVARSAMTHSSPKPVTSALVGDETVCKAFLVDSNNVAILGLEEGSSDVELTYADGSKQVLNVDVKQSWTNGSTTTTDAKMAELLSSIKQLYPESEVEIRTKPDGSLVAFGRATIESDARAIVSLIRKMYLVPVLDRVTVSR